MNAEGEQFGIARVLEVLDGASGSAEEIGKMVEAVRAFADGPLADDLSAATIRLG